MSHLLREMVRTTLYRIGALPLYHRLRNRQTLTVVTFHRVLRRSDPRWETTLAPWTLDDRTFDQCLAFFKRHYTIVGLDDVRRSLRRERSLPARSLLLTFDDGFADNFDYALPLLQKHGTPATIFVTSDRIGREERLWTEDLLSAVMVGRIGQQQVASLYQILLGANDDPNDTSLVWDIVRRGPELEVAMVETALSAAGVDLRSIRCPRQMLTSEEIVTLVLNGISIGAHGQTHTAFPLSSNPSAELHQPLAVLNEIVTPCGGSPVDAVSFPHGAYTSEIADQALTSGYKLLFTGDPELHVLDHGFLPSPYIGRLDVEGERIAPNGRFRPEVLATSLFAARRQSTARVLPPDGKRRSAVVQIMATKARSPSADISRWLRLPANTASSTKSEAR
ncbi:polysaccharide deacetylase family protein [Bradyrhizobium sp. USDA 4473]